MTVQGGFGLKVKIMVSTTLTAIADLLDADFPTMEKVLAEMTAHPTSGATGWDVAVDTGKRKSSEFMMELGWDDTVATHAAIQTAFDATTAVSMSIEDPEGSEVIAFSAHIRSIQRIGKQEDGYKARVMVKPTGAPTIT